MSVIPVGKFRVEVLPKHAGNDIHTINVHATLDNYKYELLVISIIRNFDTWTVGSSMCFPTNINDANDVRKAVNKAFQTLKRLKKCVKQGKEFKIV